MRTPREIAIMAAAASVSRSARPSCRHGGRITAHDSTLGGLRIEIELPLAAKGGQRSQAPSRTSSSSGRRANKDCCSTTCAPRSAARWVADGPAAVAEIDKGQGVAGPSGSEPARARYGIEVCRKVRAFGDVPIISSPLASVKLDRLLGLDTGADDYVYRKPFSPARGSWRGSRPQLRRTRQPALTATPQIWRIGGENLSICWRRRRLNLTVLEFHRAQNASSTGSGYIHVPSCWTGMHPDERGMSAIAPYGQPRQEHPAQDQAQTPISTASSRSIASATLDAPDDSD